MVCRLLFKIIIDCTIFVIRHSDFKFINSVNIKTYKSYTLFTLMIEVIYSQLIKNHCCLVVLFQTQRKWVFSILLIIPLYICVINLIFILRVVINDEWSIHAKNSPKTWISYSFIYFILSIINYHRDSELLRNSLFFLLELIFNLF